MTEACSGDTAWADANGSSRVWSDACHAAALFAIDPAALGGVCLRAGAGPVRDAWLNQLRQMLPDTAPVRRVPLNVADERLLGGLDLAATLHAGRPIAERGLLAESDGGVLLLAMAERISSATAARLTGPLDAGEVVLERDGMTRRFACRTAMVVLDEGDAGDERPSPALLDRCTFLLDLTAVTSRDVRQGEHPAITSARVLLPDVVADEEALTALTATAMALGVASLRAVLNGLRVARASAALAGRTMVTEADIVVAARLVLAPRATAVPNGAPPPPQLEEPPEDGQDADPPEPPGGDVQEPQETQEAVGDDPDDASAVPSDQTLQDIVLEAAAAAIPAGLLAALQSATGPLARSVGRAPAPGRAGAPKRSQRRGRPIGVRPGALVSGARLNIIETLRAAAPWQRLRRQAAPDAPARILVRRGDFRITRFQQRTQSTAIFVVDASGSSALNRLAEAKGAVELLLADCYVRRDQVALLAFRGAAATLLLPPTGSLVRAKRSLAGLVGGGGTPLASAVSQAGSLADLVRRRGQTPFIVMLTDGRGNIALDGQPGRPRAAQDALAAAQAVRAAGFAALLIDTSPNPQPQGQALAQAMGARYLPLPYADAARLSQAVRASR